MGDKPGAMGTAGLIKSIKLGVFENMTMHIQDKLLIQCFLQTFNFVGHKSQSLKMFGHLICLRYLWGNRIKINPIICVKGST